MRTWRQIAAALLMVTGGFVLVRGISYNLQQGLGWQSLVQTGVVGSLIFALGLVRWRFLRQR